MAKLRQELHDFLIEHRFVYEENVPAKAWINAYEFENVYHHDIISIYYSNDNDEIACRNMLHKEIKPLHQSIIYELTLDILRETLRNAGIIKEFVPTFRKGDKLICVDHADFSGIEKGKRYICNEDSCKTIDGEKVYVHKYNPYLYPIDRFKKLEDQPLSLILTIPQDLNGATDFEPTPLSNLTEVIFNHLNAQHKVFSVTVNHADNSVSVKLMGE